MSKIFADDTFCLSGKLSMKKADIEKLIKSNGGKIAGTVTKAVTIVIAGDDSSSKSQKAMEKGIPLKKEEWLQASIDAGKKVSGHGWDGEDAGGDEADGEKKEKPKAAAKEEAGDDGGDEGEEEEEKPKKKKKAPSKKAKGTKRKKKDAEEEGDEEGGDEEDGDAKKGKGGGGGDGKIFAGKTFCLTGTLSKKKAAVEKDIRDNGGKIAGSVTGAVTHVIAADTGSSKASKAADKGLPVLQESWLDACIAAGKLVDEGDHAAE